MEYKDLLLQMSQIYHEKRDKYGDNFTKQFKQYGGIVSIIRLEDKLERLKQILLENKKDTLDETTKDTLIDLANYSLMTILSLKETKN